MEKWFQYLVAFPNKSYIQVALHNAKKSFGILNDWHVERSVFVRAQQRAEGHNPPIDFCAILLAILSHVVDNKQTVITQ